MKVAKADRTARLFTIGYERRSPEELLAELQRLREALPLEDEQEKDAFLEWYEAMFVQRAEVGGGV